MLLVKMENPSKEANESWRDEKYDEPVFTDEEKADIDKKAKEAFS